MKARRSLNDEDAKRLWRRARHLAIRLGFGQDCEDIAQQAIMDMGAHQTIDRAVIDAIRKIKGPTAEGRSKGRDIYNRKLVVPECESDLELLHEELKELGDFKKILAKLDTREERIIISLIYKWGLTLDEIGEMFNVTGSTICLTLQHCLKKLRIRLVRRGRPKTAYNEGATLVENLKAADSSKFDKF